MNRGEERGEKCRENREEGRGDTPAHRRSFLGAKSGHGPPLIFAQKNYIPMH
jgi:hypothetical protein